MLFRGWIIMWGYLVFNMLMCIIRWSLWLADSPSISPGERLLSYLTWPLIATLLRVYCIARCTRYFDTQLHGILPWSDINRNGNILFLHFVFYFTKLLNVLFNSFLWFYTYLPLKNFATFYIILVGWGGGDILSIFLHYHPINIFWNAAKFSGRRYIYTDIEKLWSPDHMFQ